LGYTNNHLALPQFPSHASCTSCELHQEASNPGVPTVHYEQSVFPSPNKPFLIVVGMNPGYHEDKKNQPFIGPTGMMLKNVYLGSLGILDTHVIYFSNAARCATPGDTALKNSHLKACWPHTKQDIQTIADWHSVGGSIFCLGTHAAQTITKNMMGKALSLSKALDKQGTVVPPVSDNKSLQFFTTYHPAGVMRAQRLKYAVSEHLDLIGQHLQGAIASPSLPNIVPPRSPR